MLGFWPVITRLSLFFDWSFRFHKLCSWYILTHLPLPFIFFYFLISRASILINFKSTSTFFRFFYHLVGPLILSHLRVLHREYFHACSPSPQGSFENRLGLGVDVLCVWKFTTPFSGSFHSHSSPIDPSLYPCHFSSKFFLLWPVLVLLSLAEIVSMAQREVFGLCYMSLFLPRSSIDFRRS